jgi:hypothetical protein
MFCYLIHLAVRWYDSRHPNDRPRPRITPEIPQDLGKHWDAHLGFTAAAKRHAPPDGDTAEPERMRTHCPACGSMNIVVTLIVDDGEHEFVERLCACGGIWQFEAAQGETSALRTPSWARHTTAPRYRVGDGQPRNIYDEHEQDPDRPGHGRWLATAGQKADATRIVDALNHANKAKLQPK